jgi:membrane protease YdiL (CAAX protease family)
MALFLAPFGGESEPSAVPKTNPGRSTAGFFLLSFAITWGLQAPLLLARWGVLDGPDELFLPFFMLGIFGPLLAATWCAWLEGQEAEVRRLFSGLLRFRVPFVWYVVALGLPALLLWATLSGLELAGRSGPTWYLGGASGVLFGLVIGIAEEVGWRGYATPRLETRYGAVGASGFVGTLWTLWHIPMFLFAGIPLSLLLVMLLYFIGGSLMFSWLLCRTGSLAIVVLAHLGAHLNNSHLALPGEVLPLVVHAIVYAGIGVGAVYFDRRFAARSGLQRRPKIALGQPRSTPIF